MRPFSHELLFTLVFYSIGALCLLAGYVLESIDMACDFLHWLHSHLLVERCHQILQFTPLGAAMFTAGLIGLPVFVALLTVVHMVTGGAPLIDMAGRDRRTNVPQRVASMFAMVVAPLVYLIVPLQESDGTPTKLLLLFLPALSWFVIPGVIFSVYLGAVHLWFAVFHDRDEARR